MLQPAAIALLKQQHDEARRLFQELSDAGPDDRRELFQRLADALAAHAKLEEQMLYPEMARQEDLSAFAHDAVEEHLIAKRLLADMLTKDLDERVFDAKCRVLEFEVTRHMDEEESVLLPKAQRLIGKERLDALGGEMERTYSELIRGEPRNVVPREIGGAPSLM